MLPSASLLLATMLTGVCPFGHFKGCDKLEGMTGACPFCKDPTTFLPDVIYETRCFREVATEEECPTADASYNFFVHGPTHGKYYCLDGPYDFSFSSLEACQTVLPGASWYSSTCQHTIDNHFPNTAYENDGVGRNSCAEPGTEETWGQIAHFASVCCSNGVSGCD
ncbi:hypothetical protein TrVE_jg11219 [Triparma verrucosa]|uniref:Uncharacterized protein n=1 Tax=Triparma verrucosa TaxID=1606542 RepID=A0A9W7F5J2_9STRA|nr:hypothetical protein TrVE_jg11219 [Triparma verrucosa]